MVKRSHRGLGVLRAAVAAMTLLSDHAHATTSGDDSSSTTVCYPRDAGNGFCETYNNNELCDFDGGDCCECTCVPSNEWDCKFFACNDPLAACVDDDDITPDIYDNCGGYLLSIGNGACNEINNNEECGYDGGDCCECTCQLGQNRPRYDDDDYGACNAFSCIDPSAPCFGEQTTDEDAGSPTPSPVGLTSGGATSENNCFLEFISDGDCDDVNNNAGCDYDGGDCCECTCEDGLELSCDYFDNFRCRDPTVPCFGGDTTDDSPYVFPTFDDYLVDDDDFARGSMSYSFAPDEVGEPLPAVDGAVEVGTKTEVAVSATAHDVRPGRATLERGCGAIGGDGCTAELSRDGISSDVESRWSCATKIVPGGGACQIEYTFAEPQDVVDIQVAFWKGNERARTLEVKVNGELTRTHESYSGSAFNTLGVQADAVDTVTLESVDIAQDEWISLLEVLIFVTP